MNKIMFFILMTPFLAFLGILFASWKKFEYKDQTEKYFFMRLWIFIILSGFWAFYFL